MKRSRRRLEELLWITGLNALARSLHRATAGRQKVALLQSMSAFYRALLPSETLVFDIGANVGQYAEIFSSLGARVIALEPNSDCVRHIQVSYASANIETIQAVAGPRNGLATLNLSDERDDLSSVSNEWMAAIQGEHAEYAGLWSKQLTVPMLTLDTLIGHYGAPYFIKIDVEGFEESVLDGLSDQPPLISFEFNTAYLKAAMRCLDKAVFSAASVFNFAMGDPVAFELESWVGKEQIKEALTGMGNGDRYGDIFARSPAQVRSETGS